MAYMTYRDISENSLFDCETPLKRSYFKNKSKCLSRLCEICNFMTYSKVIYFHHTATCCMDSWFKCDQCSYKSRYKRGIKQHMLSIHTPPDKINWWYCHLCPSRSKTKGDLGKHIKRIHHKEEIDFTKHFKCDLCEFASRRLPSLMKHKLLMHSSLTPTNTRKQSTNYKCKFCPHVTHRGDNLKKHILEQHTPEKIKWFICLQCDYKSKNKNSLKIHTMMRHTSLDEIKWFECEQCPYKGKLKSNLRNHIIAKHILNK